MKIELELTPYQCASLLLQLRKLFPPIPLTGQPPANSERVRKAEAELEAGGTCNRPEGVCLFTSAVPIYQFCVYCKHYKPDGKKYGLSR